MQDVDYQRLKLFFLSVLWRAHWSSDWFFRNVDLGPHEPIIADFIKRGVAPPPEVYSVYLYHLTGQPDPDAMFPSRQQRLDDVNVHYLYLPGVVAMITTDTRELTPLYNPLRLNIDPPHLVAFLPYGGSEEEKHFESMMAEMRVAKSIPKRMRK